MEVLQKSLVSKMKFFRCCFKIKSCYHRVKRRCWNFSCGKPSFFACQRRRFRQETVIIECWTLITGLLFFLIFRILEEVLRIQESENYSDTKAYFF